jgi:hypothetical protein
MSYEVSIRNPMGIASIVLKLAEVVKRGDLLGISGSDWVKADADTPAMYAQWVSMDDTVGDGVKEIKVCKSCILEDLDAPYTALAKQFLSTTAGAITGTRPANGKLIQVVGQAITTKQIFVSLGMPKELELFISANGVYDTCATPGIGAEDAGWFAPSFAAATDIVGLVGRFPSNLVSVDVAKAIYDSVNASAFDQDVTVVRGLDGASNVQDTGAAITAGDFEQADTDNIMLTQDIIACFDADFVCPGANFGIKFDADGVTGAANLIGVYLRMTVVG